jgi:hypothetical protein
MDDELDAGAVLGEQRKHAVGVADVEGDRAEARPELLAQALGRRRVVDSGPKKYERMSLSSPITSKPCSTR